MPPFYPVKSAICVSTKQVEASMAYIISYEFESVLPLVLESPLSLFWSVIVILCDRGKINLYYRDVYPSLKYKIPISYFIWACGV